MARILSYPFRLSGSQIVTVDQSSDDANAEQLAILLLTVRGERPLVPSFGIPDPAFRSVDLADVNLGVALHGPPVTVEGVDVGVVDATTLEVVVRYG